MVKTAVLLTTVMFLAYLPTIIASVYEKMHGVNAVYFFGFLPFAYTLLRFNSTFNPLFYCFRNVTIRKAIRRRVNSRRRAIATLSDTLRKVKSIDLQTAASKYSAEQST